MRVGISLMYWPWFTPPEQLALAMQADRLGLHSVWVAEGYGQEAAAMLGLLAGRTDRILLGAGILQIPARQPTTAAMVASTVDRLSAGRMLLGLGLSGPQVSEGWYGVPFTAPLRRTREYVEIVRLALSGQPVAYEGAEWSMPAHGGLGLGKPRAPARTPYLAGDKQAASAALTDELCDLVALVATPATLGRRLAECAVAGVDVLVVAPFGDRARLLDALAAHNSAPLTV